MVGVISCCCGGLWGLMCMGYVGWFERNDGGYGAFLGLNEKDLVLRVTLRNIAL